MNNTSATSAPIRTGRILCMVGLSSVASAAVALAAAQAAGAAGRRRLGRRRGRRGLRGRTGRVRAGLLHQAIERQVQQVAAGAGVEVDLAGTGERSEEH